MKQLMTAIVLSVVALSAGARSVGERRVSLRSNFTTASTANMDIKGASVVFAGLTRNTATFYLMDEQGNVERSGALTRKNNRIDISALPKGGHTIALKLGNSVKMFQFSSDIVVTAARAW